MSETTEHRTLLSQSEVNKNATGWHRTVFEDIQDRLDDSTFPCVFSRNAFRKQLLKFIFVEVVDREGIQHLGAGLEEYVEISRNWDGGLDTSYPLIAAFSPDTTDGALTVEDYHTCAWEVLQKLHEIDPAQWPDEVGKDPESSTWSMCFNGMPLFCNMSNPGHRTRRSRNLGGHLTLVVNPRERFDVFAGDTPSGRKVRANIRNRVERYDRMSHSWQLGTYGAGALEWQQYGIVEENMDRTDTCPFKFRNA